MQKKIVTFADRMKVACVDAFIVCGLTLLLGIALIIGGVWVKDDSLFYLLVTGFYYSLFFCKDLLTIPSVGKNIIKLRIVDDKGENPSPLKLIARNLFLFIWPIEIIMYMVNPEKRIGDIVLKTKVITCDGRNIENTSGKPIKTLLYFILTYISTLVVLFSSLSLLQFISSFIP